MVRNDNHLTFADVGEAGGIPGVASMGDVRALEIQGAMSRLTAKSPTRRC